MVQILADIELLAQQGGGFAVNPRMPLLYDHVSLWQHRFVGQVQADHAVGFHAHHQFQTVAGDHLIVGGKVIDDGVVIAAIAGDDLREFTFA
ncbi:MAG: hypothetical protein R3D03_01665 [Geminicoccaceae bacterium]